MKSKISEQREEYKTHANFLRGLDVLEKVADQEEERFEKTNSKYKKGAISMRIDEWLDALDRREKYFFKLPTHAGRVGLGATLLPTDKQSAKEKWKNKILPEAKERGYVVDKREGRRRRNLPTKLMSERLKKNEVSDVPDWGLYPYIPLLEKGGKSTEMIELDLTHYTEDEARKEIEYKLRHAKSKKDRILIADKTGWAYFVDKPLPEGEFKGMKKLRTLLGTGHQDYTLRDIHADPQTYLKLKVRVPKENVWIKETIYGLSGTTVRYKDGERIEPEDLEFYQNYEKTSDKSSKNRKHLDKKRKTYSQERWQTLEEIDRGLDKEFFRVKKYALAGGVNLKDIISEGIDVVDRRDNISKRKNIKR